MVLKSDVHPILEVMFIWFLYIGVPLGIWNFLKTGSPFIFIWTASMVLHMLIVDRSEYTKNFSNWRASCVLLLSGVIMAATHPAVIEIATLMRVTCSKQKICHSH